jgi:hypothetical protein
MGISFYTLKKTKREVSWNSIKRYYDANISRTERIVFELKDKTQFDVENRKCIKQTIKKYSGDIPDFTSISSVGDNWRIGNYHNKFLDLYEAVFEKKQFESNDQRLHEHCLFCNVKISDHDSEQTSGHVTDMQNGKEYWICEKCYRDYQKYYRFKDK